MQRETRCYYRPMISLRRTPPAICDNCGCSCITLNQAGICCFHCHAGTFVHRSHWLFSECHCAGADPLCEFCHGRGVLATPLDDVPVESSAAPSARSRS